MNWLVNVCACLYVHVDHCIALVCTFGTRRDHTLALGSYYELMAIVSVAPRLPCPSTFMQDDTFHELLSSFLREDCQRSCVPQQLCAGPLTGRGGRHSASEMLVPMLLQEMIMSEVEDLVDLIWLEVSSSIETVLSQASVIAASAKSISNVLMAHHSWTLIPPHEKTKWRSCYGYATILEVDLYADTAFVYMVSCVCSPDVEMRNLISL